MDCLDDVPNHTWLLLFIFYFILFFYTSMNDWLHDLKTVPPLSFKQISNVLPGLHSRIEHLMTPPDLSSSDNGKGSEAANPGTVERATRSTDIVWVLNEIGVSGISLGVADHAKRLLV
jgi:hypothetical protein